MELQWSHLVIAVLCYVVGAFNKPKSVDNKNSDVDIKINVISDDATKDIEEFNDKAAGIFDSLSERVDRFQDKVRETNILIGGDK